MKGWALPVRRAVRTASMATLPPPMTATRSPRLTRLPRLTSRKKVETRIDPLQIFAFDAQGLAQLGADPQKESLISLPAQLTDGKVLADLHAGFELDAQVPDGFYFGLDDGAGQPVGGNAHGEHTSQNGQFFKDRDRIPLEGQKIGAGQPGRSGADDGHLLRPGVFFLREEGPVAFLVPVGQKAVQIHDRQGFVDRLAGTGPFTGVVADPAADPGKGMVFFEQLHGFPVFSGIDQGDVPLNAHMGRAGRPAGGGAALGDGIAAGDRLGVLFKGGLSPRKALVVFVGQLDGADFGAFPATGALGQVHEAGLLPESGFEISRFSVQSQDLGIGQKFDVQVPADLDQFGRDNSHGTVVGGKRLVQLGHQSADGR